MIAHSTEDQRHVVVGQSPRLRHIMRLVEKLGRGNWPVLLLGETGTGKEVIARAIHNVSPAGPFVTIDCSSLVGPLMESELFGHARGAFTGAVAQKTGLIELADGGTALFDEIGELPLDLQSRLLRVLQEKEFRPVGSLVTRHSDFRIIAATNRDLANEVEKGTFRRDLYYRLNVVSLRLSPLRDRREDIPALLAHFLNRYGNGHTLSQDTLETLLSYDWPGNVRELENCVQHMVAINSGSQLHLIDLPSTLQNHVVARRSQSMETAATANSLPPPANDEMEAAGPRPVSFVSPDTPAPVLPLSELEKRAIIAALEYTKGDRAVAAHLLGIGRTTLYRKLKEYELEPEHPAG